MKNKIFIFLSIFIVGLSLFLRLYKIENRAPFDWDQNRDYVAITEIVKGDITLVGPVAKGEGGFFLGPLYYYVVTPVYLMMGGSPISLPVTSSILDLLSIVAVLALLPSIWGYWQSISLATIWSLSWFAIESSRTSWNVSLIPLWSIIFIYLLSRSLSLSKAVLLGLMAGLAWHIHAALIPLSLLVVALNYRRLGISIKSIGLFTVGYLIPLIPLVIFDIRHSGLERMLISQFFAAKNLSDYPWSEVIISVVSRFGKNTVAIVTGLSDLHLGWGVAMIVTTVLALFRGTRAAQIASWIVIVNLGLAIFLRDTRFPEYYLAASYLAMMIICLDLIFHFKKIMVPLLGAAMIMFVYVNISKYTVDKTSFSLSQKLEVVDAMAKLGDTLDVHYDLPIGRDSGIPALLTRSGVRVSKKADIQAVVTESTGDSIFIDGEIAKDIGWFGGLRLAYRAVQ